MSTEMVADVSVEVPLFLMIATGVNCEPQVDPVGESTYVICASFAA